MHSAVLSLGQVIRYPLSLLAHATCLSHEICGQVSVKSLAGAEARDSGLWCAPPRQSEVLQLASFRWLVTMASLGQNFSDFVSDFENWPAAIACEVSHD
jgi:hypothetical protein